MNEFIASGYNKSGTTYLQQLLDNHPEISCAPEQHLKTLITAYSKTTADYEKKISLFDQRTARQGIRFQRSKLMERLTNTTIDALLYATTNASDRAVGFNDNWIADFLHLLHHIRPGLKFIYIVRDPRDVAVSLYHHIQRTEPERVKGRSIDTFCRSFGALWNKHISVFVRFSVKRPNHIRIVRYEDLVRSDKAPHLAAIIEFLGVASTKTQCAQILDTQRENFEKSRLKGNGFYRVGDKSNWHRELKPSTNAAIKTRCSVPMRTLGYLIDD